MCTILLRATLCSSFGVQLSCAYILMYSYNVQPSVKLCEPDGSFFLVQCWNRVSISLQDEVTAPLSVAFHPHGSKMYCGFHNCIRIFDITRAGRQAETRSTFGEL